MDLSLPLIGVLGLVGYNLNKKPNTREYTDKRIKIPTSELQNGKTIYESKDYVRYQAEEQSKLDSFYKNKNTVISTNSYTTNSNTTFPGGINKVTGNPIDSVSQINYPNKETRIYNGPMFSEGGYYSLDTAPKELKETFDSDVSELSGLKTDFTHTNMQPFFGSNVKQPQLDAYGSMPLVAKTEVEMQMNTDTQDINGMKPFTQLVDMTRYTTGRSINNVVPFKQYREPPIPPEYARGSEKSVDELRALNKPKATGMEAVINHGSGNYMRPIDPVFVKNRVNTVYSGDFNGIYPTFNKHIEETYIPRTIEDLRMTTKDVMENPYNMGTGYYPKKGNKTQISRNEGSDTYHTGSHKFELANDWVRNAKRGIPLRDENTQDTYIAYEQERETTNRENFGNVFKPTADKMKSLDKAKTTNKELTLYSYTPTAHSQIQKNPVGREFYNKTHSKTKPSKEYFAGGVKKFTPQNNKANVSHKQRTTVKDYTGPTKMNNIQYQHMVGETSNKKYKQMERDLGYRLEQFN